MTEVRVTTDAAKTALYAAEDDLLAQVSVGGSPCSLSLVVVPCLNGQPVLPIPIGLLAEVSYQVLSSPLEASFCVLGLRAPAAVVEALKARHDCHWFGDAFDPASDIIHVTTKADSGAGSLREAITRTRVSYVVFDVGGYFDVLTPLYPNSHILIDGSTAPAPVQLRVDLLKTTDHLMGFGNFYQEIEWSGMRHVTLVPGYSNFFKKQDFGIYNGYNIWLDHVTSILSNNEAFYCQNLTNTLSIRSRPNCKIWSCLFGQTLYGPNTNNWEGSHPMNWNVQEGAVVLMFQSGLLCCSQRNPTCGEACDVLLQNCFLYAVEHYPEVGDKPGSLRPAKLQIVNGLAQRSQQSKPAIGNGLLLNNVSPDGIIPLQPCIGYSNLIRWDYTNALDTLYTTGYGSLIAVLNAPDWGLPIAYSSPLAIKGMVMDNAGATLPAVPPALEILRYQVTQQLGNARIATVQQFFSTNTPRPYALDSRGYPG